MLTRTETSITILAGAAARSVTLFGVTLLTACSTVQTPEPSVMHAGTQAHSMLIARTPVRPDLDSALRTHWMDDVRVVRALQAPVSVMPDARDLARSALEQLGIKYRYGGKTPATGFDCSGLVVFAAEQSLGLKLPHHAATMARLGTAVKKHELREGDLVFFNTRGKRFSHMGIYLGDQQFVHAPRKGTVVRVERMDKPYWQKRYNGARRLDTDTLAALASAEQVS